MITNIKTIEIKKLLDEITDQILDWTADKTSPGVKRAHIREEIFKSKMIKIKQN